MFNTPLPESERAQRALSALAQLSSLRGRPVEWMPRVLQAVLEITGADGVGFERREGDELVYVLTAGSLADQVGVRTRVGGSLGGVALLSRTAATSADVREDPRVDRDVCLRSGAGSLVAVPVDMSGAPAGALVAAWREPHGFNDATVHMLRLAATQIEALLARRLVSERGEDAERLMAIAFSQTEHREANQRVSSDLDGLTGLLNRAPFETALKASVTHWSPGQGSAVLFVDLDHFKRVNEMHGHPAGDAVLQRVAEILRRCTRGHDVLARLGNDDFAVLLNRLSDPAIQAAVAAERIVDSVMADNVLNEAMPRIRMSIGAALIDRAGLSAELVLSEADEALTAEKADRR
jgi:diguanylate cyclase (GGDEF)-like protein